MRKEALSSHESTQNTRSKKYELHREKSPVNRKKKNIISTIIHWSNLLRDVAELSSLGIFNT